MHVGQWTGLNKWTDVGAKGVPLFFILSGYLAMVSCHRIFKHGWHVKDYYIGRAKRILPMYYWALFLDYIYSIYMYHSQGLSIPEIFNFFKGPCGIRYIRYVFFCNMYYHQIILHGGIIDLHYGQWVHLLFFIYVRLWFIKYLINFGKFLALQFFLC